MADAKTEVDLHVCRFRIRRPTAPQLGICPGTTSDGWNLAGRLGSLAGTSTVADYSILDFSGLGGSKVEPEGYSQLFV